MINWIPTDDLFIIGNGAPVLSPSGALQYNSAGNVVVTPSNALVVKKNGDTTVYGNLTVSGSSNVVLINPAGDISMGGFISGPAPK